jgi:hypothetical protein
LKGNDLKRDPGDQVQNSRPHATVLEIMGDDDGRADMIRISIAVLIGKEGFPFPKGEEVIWARRKERHEFNLKTVYQ